MESGRTNGVASHRIRVGQRWTSRPSPLGRARDDGEVPAAQLAATEGRQFGLPLRGRNEGGAEELKAGETAALRLPEDHHEDAESGPAGGQG